MMKRYSFEYCMNLRDLGGYPLGEDRYIPYRQFLRSDAPVKLTDDEIKVLRKLQVSTVIDLRYPDEAMRRPCALNGVDGFRYYNLSIGSGGLPVKEDEICLSYLDFTEQKGEMLQIFQIISHAPAGVLYHCTAGKDRTGVISALLLLLAGADEADILADYQVSYTYIRKLISIIRQDNPDLPAFAGQSKPEYMESFLHEFLLEYQSAEQYLRLIGLEQAEVDQIKSRLITTF